MDIMNTSKDEKSLVEWWTTVEGLTELKLKQYSTKEEPKSKTEQPKQLQQKKPRRKKPKPLTKEEVSEKEKLFKQEEITMNLKLQKKE